MSSSSGGFAPGQFNEPRSAPRPPTDRPRLNITPTIHNLPGNMQNMSLNSPAPSLRSASTLPYNSSSTSVPLKNIVSNNATDSNGMAVIKEGLATVKDGKTFLNPWRQKYLVLRKDVLDFHKARDGKVSYKIVLKDVVAVSRVEASGIIFEIKRYADGASTNPGDDSDGVRSLKIKVDSDDDLYQWIDFIYARCPGMGGVSNPTNFAHAVHVGFDNTTGKFVGLPPEWSKLLNSSAITKEDYEKDPQAVFEVLEFYSDITKRAEHPEAYSSLTPTPSATNNNNKQLGYAGSGGGNSVAGPRQPPNAGQRNPSSSYSSSQNHGGMAPVSGSQQQQIEQMKAMASQFKTEKQQPSREEQYQREMQQARDRERRDAEDRERRELAEYNASLPKTRVPMAQQEIGGGGYSSPSTSDRYNPTRAAPPAPGGSRQPQAAQQSLRTQREAPRAPTRPNPSSSQSSSSSVSREQQLREREQREREQGRSLPRTNNENQRQDPRYQNAQQSQPGTRHQNGQAAGSTTPRGDPPAQSNAPKPLNVTKQTPAQNGIKQNDAIKAAEAALTAKPPATKREDVRMSTMSEADVMLKLKEIVSKDDPSLSYTKQKKIGQGASGSVYVAKVRADAVSPVARQVIRDQGPKAQVAIKQMDLAHQPRKELIVNEIIVMKDSKHRNIVNFLDAFLRNNSSELWVVMEFMEGGALTDVIDSNQGVGITEEQIACICLEVSEAENYSIP